MNRNGKDIIERILTTQFMTKWYLFPGCKFGLTVENQSIHFNKSIKYENPYDHSRWEKKKTGQNSTPIHYNN